MPSIRKIHATLFIVALIYGASYSIAKQIMPVYIMPFGMIFLRTFFSTLLFLGFSELVFKEKIKYRKDYYRLATCGLFGIAINQLCFFKGISITSPVNASVIMTNTPILVLVVSAIILKEKITKLKVFGVAFGMVGAIMIIIGGSSFSFNSKHAIGDVLIFINAASYGIYLVIVKPLMTRYNPITVAKWVFFFGFLIVIPFGLTEVLEVNWTQIPFHIWLSITFIIIGTTFFAYLLNIWTLKYVNASLVGFYIYFQPLLATSFAYFFGYYDLTAEKGLYALMIFIGVYLVSKKS